MRLELLTHYNLLNNTYTIMKKNIPLSLLFLILCASSIFLNTNAFTDSLLLPKWLFAVIGLAIMGVIYAIQVFLKKDYTCNIRLWNAIIVVLCVLQAGYGILQFCNILPPTSSTYKVTGSFDNPAGFAGCLTAGLAFTVYFLLEGNNKKVQWMGWIALLIISSGIFLSESRAGLLCIATIASVHLLLKKYKQIHNKKGFVLLGTWFVILLINAVVLLSFYQLNKKSANGRLLIWKCTTEMIKDKPITGHGIGAFEAKYMDYQAAYFKAYPDSKFAMLADNVKHPFNEYLLVGVQFGIIGWIVLLVLLAFLIYCYLRNPSPEGYVALLTLLSIGVFSFFSYPFTYPFTWIVVGWCIFVLIVKGYKKIKSQKNAYKGILRQVSAIVLLIISVLLLYRTNRRILAEREWGKISKHSLVEQTQLMLLRYQKLLPVLAKDPYFSL